MISSTSFVSTPPNSRPRGLRTALAAVLGCAVVTAAQARITHLEYTKKESPTFEGTTFGTVGAYEYVHARAHGELDPRLEGNRGILNLDKAPHNTRGMVEYSMDVTILKPVDNARGNGAILYDVLNRGTKRLLTSRVNGGGGFGEARRAADIGTGYLMNQGYTMVWSGWHGELESNPELRRGNSTIAMMAGQFPVAAGVVEPLREEFNFDDTEKDPVYKLTYATASRDMAKSVLTVRARERDPRQQPAGLGFEWVSDTEIRVKRPEGFDAGAIYELVYPARDPIVSGVGFAATRDLLAFLRYSAADDKGQANPVLGGGRNPIDRAIALGISQSGRYIRDFTYQGFNTTEEGKIVFEGIMPLVAGSRRTMVNDAFSKPGDFSREHETHLARGDQFPFTYAVLHDPISGKTDGILHPGVRHQPKVMHIDTDTEFYQARASLVMTDSNGRPVQLPSNVRAYYISGSQHAPSSSLSWSPISQQLRNPLNYGEFSRALIHAMDEWVRGVKLPPPSRFPNVTDGTLVAPNSLRAAYPKIPHFLYEGTVNVVRYRDESVTPSAEGAAYAVLVTARDADGNNLGGLRHPLIEAPLGTHAGWNLRNKGYGENALNNLDGSFMPFARTKTERERSGDERLSVEERYPSVDAWVNRVSAAADRLVAERFLLRSDADQIVADAKAKGFDYFGPVPVRP